MDQQETVNPESANNDRLTAAICYPISIVALAVLLSEGMRARPFLKYHAVQGLASKIMVLVVMALLTVITFGLSACLIPLAFVIHLIWAYKAYQGERFAIPWLTDFCRDQGWFD